MLIKIREFTKAWLIGSLIFCLLGLGLAVQAEEEEVTNNVEEYLDEDDEINIDKKIKKMNLEHSEDIFETRASWYGGKFHGRRTAANEFFDSNGLSAAHRSLPMGTHLLITNPANDKQVIVRVNDRGPFVQGREIDLSEAAAKVLDFLRAGVANVRYEILKLKD